MRGPAHTLLAVVLSLSFVSLGFSQEYLPGLKWPEPKAVTPGAENSDPPSDAVVLFDGKDLSAFRNADNWTVEDGVMIAGSGNVFTRQEFGDCQLHIEWSAATPPKGHGQGRSNSGVYFLALEGHDGFEVQVLDSYKNPTYYDGQAGSLYKQQPPMVNVTRPPGEWNTYDIFWTAPRFDADGKLESHAYLTVMHNGVLIQNHVKLAGETRWHGPPVYRPVPEKGPIKLQDHGNPVRFRNIWIREYQKLTSEKAAEPKVRWGDKTVPYKPGDELKHKP